METLLAGEPLPNEGRELPFAKQEWLAQDRRTGLSEPVLKPDQILGTERPPHVEVVAQADEAFKASDDLIRDAYRRSGGGFELAGDEHWRWENFEANLRASGVSEEDFDKWLNKVTSIKYTPPGSTLGH